METGAEDTHQRHDSAEDGACEQHGALGAEALENHQQDGCHDEYGSNGRMDIEGEAALVACPHGGSGFLHGLTHTLLQRLVLLARLGLEEQRAQSRRQRQGVHGRETDSHGHRYAELLVEHAAGARHERYRDEHKHHHKSDGDKRAGYLVHGVDGGAARAAVALVKLGMNSLHHHYRIVHHDRNSKHKGRESDEVERESYEVEHEERSDEGHGNGDGGNQCAAEVLKEDVHHDEHEHESFDKRMDHIVDGGVQEVVVVHRHFHLQTLGKVGLQLVDSRQTVVDNLCGVRARALEHDGHR